ncbi:TIM-barrel domain-containing protein [Angustibacter sp. McL0619]|uniref:TIM-barrel domain-containing protein n=1 Tax=Angustibacter sp. McL0619 TaxID=3415676 RepID=UPI003CE9518D
MRRATRVLVSGVATALACAVVLVAAFAGRLPGLHGDRDASDLVPGLLQVQPGLRGAVSLGNGVYVQFGLGGLLVTRQSATVWRGVDQASPFTAGLGHLAWSDAGTSESSGWEAHDGPHWQVREQVDRTLGNLQVTGRTLSDRNVVYTGRIFHDQPRGADSLPFRLTITRREPDSRIVMDVQVPGADAVAMHAYRRPGWSMRGAGVQGDQVLLRDGRYPILVRGTGVHDTAGASLGPVPMLLSSASNGFAVDGTGYTTLDLRHQGRVDTTVWQPELSVRLYDGTPVQMVSQHSSDAGRLHPLPVWATSGAVVGVRGSTQRVLDAAVQLLDANAVLAAVLVQDGGERPRYPGWHALVDRLSAKDVRVLTSVSPSLALRARASRPTDEQQLLATARDRGFLVTDASGRSVQVRTPDPDVGSVPGALIDLTNPAAVTWYTTVLADRMRDERLSGWQVLGGAELPPNARLAEGSAATEHNAWPARWAAMTRQACVDAGRPDCLLLQDTASERATDVGAFGLGQLATDWSQRGLGAVLPATLNAGVAGLTVVAAPVGGTSTVTSWSGRAQERTDELLARWAELASMGSLLVTSDGDRPDANKQVWDSPARLAAFAHTSRVFAALAQYRRSAVRQAVVDGLPVVRPLWLEDPELSQDRTAEQFMFGDSLLVVPVLKAGQRAVQASLPPGTWVDLFTGERHVVGPPSAVPSAQASTATDLATPQEVTLAAPVGRAVVLYREGDDDGAAARRALAGADLLVPTSPPASVPQP